MSAPAKATDEAVIQIEPRFNVDDIVRRGREFQSTASALYEKEAVEGRPNFKFYTQILLSELLLSYLLLYLAGRAGNLRLQIEQKRALVPYATTATNNKYQQLFQRWLKIL